MLGSLMQTKTYLSKERIKEEKNEKAKYIFVPFAFSMGIILDEGLAGFSGNMLHKCGLHFSTPHKA